MIRKQQRFTIARSLYEALLEEEPTAWTEEEIKACLKKEEFASYQINQLLESDFDRKPRKFGAFTPTSPTGPPPAATSPAPAPFASSSPSPAPSTSAPVNTSLIFPTQPSGTGPAPAV